MLFVDHSCPSVWNFAQNGLTTGDGQSDFGWKIVKIRGDTRPRTVEDSPVSI